MKLKRVHIKNFRSIKDIELNFDPTCRALVGINESGKSNILHALALLEYDELIRKRDKRERLPEEDIITEAFVKFVFTLKKEEVNQIFNSLSSKIISNISNPKIISLRGVDKNLKDLCGFYKEATWVCDILDDEKWVDVNILDKNETTVLEGWKKPTDNCPPDFQFELNGNLHTLKDYNLIQLDESFHIPEEFLGRATLAEVESLYNEAIGNVLKENIPDVLFWNYNKKNLLPNSINIDEFVENPDICKPLKNMFTLAGIEDISASLEENRKGSSNEFGNYLHAIATATTVHFRQVWKDHQSIEFVLKEGSNDQIIPGIREKNTYDFEKRSDGFKRFVTFLLLISFSDRTKRLKNTLLLVDEAEIGLHPSGARYLRDELIKIAKNNYVVYSTHSIFMIDVDNPKQHYIVEKKDEITSIRQAKDSNIKDEEVLYNALKFSTFEILQKDNVIFEGWRDKTLFQVYITKLPEELKVKCNKLGICHAKGASSFAKITPMIELAERKCLIVSDSDKTSLDNQRSYCRERNFGDWKTYRDIDKTIEAITGEDFIQNDVIIKIINEVLKINNISLAFDKGILKESDKLGCIKGWLEDNGIKDKEQVNIIKEIKDSVFQNLKYEHINDIKYKKLFEGIIAHFSKTKK